MIKLVFMKATAIESIEVINTWEIEGEQGFETPCVDYLAWCGLPAAATIDGSVYYAKTGWNSDTGRACYKTGRKFARIGH